MSHLIDILLVAAVLLGALLYAILALGPRAWRQQISKTLTALGLARIAPKTSGACGGCDTCASPDAKETAGPAETRIGLKDIGRRQT
jgi:hypothetical protein